jgi:hypothetical protein
MLNMSKSGSQFLINRLSTDNVNLLLKEYDLYPTTIQNCIDDMMEKTSWCELKYDTICTLNSVIGMGYDPSGVDSLFNNQ